MLLFFIEVLAESCKRMEVQVAEPTESELALDSEPVVLNDGNLRISIMKVLL
uniref:Uncharacterized protein n=1 Tax=Physcomitrium patens TaxID=3218 RepID=A0A2K1JH34_PHYPA|nr:hypothetical protein PHYPA_018261 [Physcomitrium patens]